MAATASRTVWKGAISFGRVSIPVRLYAATEEKNISFHQVHALDGGRIRYQRFCDKDGAQVPYAQVAKGYELPDGAMVVLTEADLASLPVSSSRTIAMLQCVPAAQVDSLYLSRSYYVQADSAGAKAYVLLRDALARSGQIAIVTVTLHAKQMLATLWPRGEVLVLQTLFRPDEIRSTETIAPSERVTVRPQEAAMARSYIKALTGAFEPEQFPDEHQRAVEELVAAKATGQEAALPEQLAVTGEIADLMTALRASIEAAQKSRGRAASGVTVSGPAQTTAEPRRQAAAPVGQGRRRPVTKPVGHKSA